MRKPVESRKALFCAYVPNRGYLYETVSRTKPEVARLATSPHYAQEPFAVLKVKIVEVVRPPKARRTKPTK